MAVSEAQLRKMLQKYKYRDLSVREIMNVIGLYRDLKPLPDNYVFNDGTSRELLSLSGTIPVPYKGNTYNIPICLWLLDTYPYNPPICFVKPISTMTIKTGKCVDANGKIYLPYLHEWKHPPSDLLGLIQFLIVVFGEHPPVFSRSAAPAPAQCMYSATGPPNPSPTLPQDDAIESSEEEEADCDEDAKSYKSHRAPTQESDPTVIFTDKVVVMPRNEIVETAPPNPQSVNPDNQQAIDIYLDCLQKIRQVVDDTEVKLLALKARAL